jgi:hypothetical protein
MANDLAFGLDDKSPLSFVIVPRSGKVICHSGVPA